MKKEPKLIVELIPKTCQYINARTIISSKYWDKIRLIVYKKADNKCEICGEHGLKQGFKHRVECHEVWKYQDRKKVQKLIKLMCLCPLCHQAKHIGRTSLLGNEMKAYDRLQKINKWNAEELFEHINKAYEKNNERSSYEWIIDLSLLNKKPFNIPSAYTQPPKKKPKKRY